MKKLIFLLLCIPLISSAQYGESRYVEIDVVDQYGNSVGTMSMMARHVDTYSNGYEVAVDKYIQYLEEKETRERAERQRNALNQRLRSLGISEVPSWDTNGIIAAAMEGYASGVERGNSSYGSNNEYNALLEKYNSLLSSYNKLKIGYDKLLKERNSNRKSYSSSVNRQSSTYSYGNKSSNNVKSGVKFIHYKQPKLFGGEWGTYTSGLTDIEFVDDKLYRSYYRKVRIKGNVGYINMNSFK